MAGLRPTTCLAHWTGRTRYDSARPCLLRPLMPCAEKHERCHRDGWRFATADVLPVRCCGVARYVCVRAEASCATFSFVVCCHWCLQTTATRSCTYRSQSARSSCTRTATSITAWRSVRLSCCSRVSSTALADTRDRCGMCVRRPCKRCSSKCLWTPLKRSVFWQQRLPVNQCVPFCASSGGQSVLPCCAAPLGSRLLSPLLRADRCAHRSGALCLLDR